MTEFSNEHTHQNYYVPSQQILLMNFKMIENNVHKNKKYNMSKKLLSRSY